MRARLLLAALLALSACGFEGEPPFAGSRVADVAPWQDVGPITFCDGAARIGSLEAGALGACASGSPRACRTDGECGSREHCVCGRCARPVCDSAEECRADEVCSFDERVCDRSCATDRDCKSGETCVAGKGVCRGTCSQSADCQAGERCQLATGLCVPATCTSDSDCVATCDLERTPAALAEPSPLVEASGVTMWVEREDPMGAPAIWRATSTDGMNFTFAPAQPVATGRAPSILRDATGYHLALVQGGVIQVLDSPDGIAFGPPALTGLAGDQPSLVRADDASGYDVYFVSGGAIERATSPDASFQFGAPSAALTPAQATDPLLWRGVDQLASPFVERLTDPAGQPFVRLWFAGHGTESASSEQFGSALPTPPDFSIGEAAALLPADPAAAPSFVPYPFNPVFDRVLSFLTHPSELDPAVIELGGAWLLYYRRADADGAHSENLAVASSPVEPR